MNYGLNWNYFSVSVIVQHKSETQSVVGHADRNVLQDSPYPSNSQRGEQASWMRSGSLLQGPHYVVRPLCGGVRCGRRGYVSQPHVNVRYNQLPRYGVRLLGASPSVRVYANRRVYVKHPTYVGSRHTFYTYPAKRITYNAGYYAPYPARTNNNNNHVQNQPDTLFTNIRGAHQQTHTGHHQRPHRQNEPYNRRSWPYNTVDYHQGAYDSHTESAIDATSWQNAINRIPTLQKPPDPFDRQRQNSRKPFNHISDRPRKLHGVGYNQQKEEHYVGGNDVEVSTRHSHNSPPQETNREHGFGGHFVDGSQLDGYRHRDKIQENTSPSGHVNNDVIGRSVIPHCPQRHQHKAYFPKW